MKIQGPGSINKVNPYNKIQNRNQVSNIANHKKDELQISNEAKAMLDELNQVIQPERKHKIAELKQQIENGKYQVDAGKVAEKLMEWWRL